LAVLTGSAAAQEKQVTDDQYAELQKNFSDAYNREAARDHEPVRSHYWSSPPPF
jgi:hypothetical protein